MDPCVRVCRGTFWPNFFFLEMTRKPTIFQKTTTFLLVVFLKNVYSLTPSWYFWHNVSYKVKTCRSGHLCPPPTRTGTQTRADKQTRGDPQTHRRTDVQTCRSADAHTCRCTHAQTHACANARIHRRILFDLILPLSPLVILMPSSRVKNNAWGISFERDI